jgi:ZIP family zinc transporter
VWAAAFFGALSALTLLVGALIAYAVKPAPRLTAAIMALGSGLLIGSVAYDLVGEATQSLGIVAVSITLMLGAGVFVLGSRIVERSGARQRKHPQPTTEGNPKAMVLGSVLDGVPESFVLGLSVLQGAVSAPLLIGISLSNLPEGMASSSGLRQQGWPLRRTVGLWTIVIATSAISAVIGHELLANDDGTVSAIARMFAAGALLAMITDTMVPEAYAVERTWTGGLVVGGFALSLVIASLLG